MTPWTTPELLAVELGAVVTADDPTVIECADAANAWCRRQRLASGYPDTDTTVTTELTRAATMYGARLWRARVATDGYASYPDVPPPTVGAPGGLAEVRRLLGVPRPVAV